MKKMKYLVAMAVALATATTANAGGMLTNTNQSVAFLRNPARDGAIAIDGVYSNPAGVAFLNDGWHFNVNWQCAVQTRTVETTSPYLDHTLSAFDADGKYIPGGDGKNKRYRGHATAPCIPSASAAYNKGKWSFQFHFAVSGGGGKCQYENGLGDFEGQVGYIASQLKPLGVKGYGVDCYMEGRQYYYGITLGAAYKVLPTLSVYAGLRGLIASASYQAQIQNITVSTSDGLHYLSDFIDSEGKYLAGVIASTKEYNDKYGAQYDQLKAAKDAGISIPGLPDAQRDQLIAAIEGYNAATKGQEGLARLEPYRNGVDLTSDQSGFGIAPILGIDWKPNKYLNLAAKYEFRTKMSLTNSSNLEKSSMSATAQYVNGTTVREDSPAMLALGAQISPIDIVRIGLGYHHFYDKDAQKFNNRQDLLSKGTDEYLGGVEVNCTDRLIVSCGAQITNYGNTDAFMSDQSFVTNSWSFGFGASYQANKNVKIEAAYFKTFYNDYTAKTTDTSGVATQDTFSRTNDVIGVGLVINL